MVIQIKYNAQPIRLKTVSELPKEGDFLYIPNKVRVTKVQSSALTAIVYVEDCHAFSGKLMRK